MLSVGYLVQTPSNNFRNKSFGDNGLFEGVEGEDLLMYVFRNSFGLGSYVKRSADSLQTVVVIFANSKAILTNEENRQKIYKYNIEI